MADQEKPDTEQPNAEQPNAEQSDKPGTPAEPPESPQAESPQADEPQAEAPQPEPPQPDASQDDAPQAEAPAPEEPATDPEPATADAAATAGPAPTGTEEKQIASELGIGAAGKVEIDQGVIDELLGDAVIGYEEIFRDTALAPGNPEAAATGGIVTETGEDQGGEEVVDHNLRLIRDVNMKVKVELGRGEMYLKDILMLGQGSVVELERLAGDPLDIYVNDKVIARGEVLVLNENFCIRITEIHNPVEALKTEA